jgi:SAM-dependent methyltransferase
LRAAVAFDELTAWILRHHRLAALAFWVRDLAMRVEAVFMRGDGPECPCCGGRFRRFRRSKVTSLRGICPRCHSFSRQRAMTLLLERMDLQGRRVLHFAPERALDPVFDRLPGVDRVTTDLYAPADLQLDITNIDLPDGSFDLVICSHVLEHVPDDRAALRELARIVAPDGMALIVIPYHPGRRTFEDPAVTKRLAKAVAFGQPGHVRVYGIDFGERLQEAGFLTEDSTGADLFDEETLERYQLRPREHFFHCRVE